MEKYNSIGFGGGVSWKRESTIYFVLGLVPNEGRGIGNRGSSCTVATGTVVAVANAAETVAAAANAAGTIAAVAAAPLIQ